jgi:predicted phage-related endonuclease
MTGDVDKIMRLYRELTGEAEEENLDDNWAVQLGHATEQLNLDWYEKTNGRLLSRRGQVAIHPDNDWAAATLDGYDDILDCPIECKHVGGREPIDIIIDRYQPQMHWQMYVTRAAQCALSVIMGTNPPVVTYVPRDIDYATEMVKRAENFMYCVGMRNPPVAMQAPVAPPAYDTLTTRDMTGDNEWAAHAGIFLENRPAHEHYEDAKASLKAKIKDTERELRGHGVYVRRARNNSIHVRAEK